MSSSIGSYITLRVQDSSTFVVGKMTKELYQEFKKTLGYKDPNAIWRGKNAKNWDGYVTTVCFNKTYCKCSLKKDGVHFPTGLYSRALEFFRAYGVDVTTVDERTEAKTNNIVLTPSPSFQVRDYQQEVIDKAVNQQRGIIKVATGGGKCSRESDICITAEGLLTFGELGSGLEENQYREKAILVSSPLIDGNREVTSHVYRDGWGATRKYITDKGFESASTHNHKIKVLTKNGIEWKKISELEVQDYAVLSKGHKLFGKQKIDCDEAYFLGILYGDGCFTPKICEWNCLQISNSDKHILNFIETFASKQDVSYNNKISSSSVICRDFRIFSKKFIEKLKIENKIVPSHATNKEITKAIRQSTQESMSMFIRGLFETDGWCCYEKSKPTLAIAFSSKKLIDQLHVILLNYGIVAHRRLKKTTHADSHVLTIYRDYIPVFMKEIGFDPDGHKYKKLQKMMEDCKDIDHNSNSDLIPNQQKKIARLRWLFARIIGYRNVRDHMASFCKDVTYAALRSWSQPKSWRFPSRFSLMKYVEYVKKETLQRQYQYENSHKIFKYAEEAIKLCEYFEYICREDFFYDKIDSIEDDWTDNYDFVVPKTHSFVAQGFINHNTAIGAGIIQKLSAAPFIFYVTSNDLLRQAKDELEKFLLQNGSPLKVGSIGGGKFDIKDVNVLTVQTAIRAVGEKYHKFDEDDEVEEISEELQQKREAIASLIHNAKGIICDEVQHWAAETCQVLADHSVNARFRFGLSATPWRDMGDDLLIDSCFGKLIHEINASFLIRKGILVKPTIYFVHTRKSMDEDINYATAYKEGIVQNEERNLLIGNIAQNMVKEGRHVLILVRHIEHGELLEAMIPDSFFVHGSKGHKVRQTHIDDMRLKKVPVTIATSIFDEGVDVKPLDGLILAGSGKSQTRALQRIGRVIRTFEDPASGFVKKDAYIVDFHDNMKYMLAHSRARRRIYETEPEFVIKDFKGIT